MQLCKLFSEGAAYMHQQFEIYLQRGALGDVWLQHNFCLRSCRDSFELVPQFGCGLLLQIIQSVLAAICFLLMNGLYSRGSPLKTGISLVGSETCFCWVTNRSARSRCLCRTGPRSILVMLEFLAVLCWLSILCLCHCECSCRLMRSKF